MVSVSVLHLLSSLQTINNRPCFNFYFFLYLFGVNDRNTLSTWLTWVKDHCGLNPSKFMVDCSQTETEALLMSFRTLDIYYCSFHVAQAWERKAKEFHGVSIAILISVGAIEKE